MTRCLRLPALLLLLVASPAAASEEGGGLMEFVWEGTVVEQQQLYKLRHLLNANVARITCKDQFIYIRTGFGMGLNHGAFEPFVSCSAQTFFSKKLAVELPQKGE